MMVLVGGKKRTLSEFRKASSGSRSWKYMLPGGNHQDTLSSNAGRRLAGGPGKGNSQREDAWTVSIHRYAEGSK